MVIKNLEDIPIEQISGYNGVKKQICLGPSDGSNEIVMRYFSVEPGGTTPFHNHDFPHLIKIEKGQGVLLDSEGKQTPIKAGCYIYLNDNEIHGFKNTGTLPLDFICIVPIRGER